MKQNRRKFFGLIGAGAVGAFASQFVPFKLLAGNDGTSSEIGNKPKVIIHPLAVPRTKRSDK
ncbi:MAG: hypothetical protein KF896_12835 [Ignavibacteriae bacterium]|nr:hypothetical protein [Ignavibacteriota bacterium]